MTTQTDTLEDLKTRALAIVGKEFECDPVPAAILTRCKAREGKPITKRDAAALMEEFPGLWMSVKVEKTWGTSIIWYVNPNTGYWDESSGDRMWREYDSTMAAKRQALVDMGVPTGYHNARTIRITGYMQNAGVTRWPTPEELTKHNQWAYSAREERNQERQQAISYIASGGDLEKIAALVDQLNLLTGELRGYVADAPIEVRRAIKDALESTATTLKLD